ncbi:MAG: hypothetical protein AAF203_02030, partial [Pseudomonadota bacterium]
AAYVERKRNLDSAELRRLRVFPAQQDLNSLNYAAKVNVNTSQLTQNYWMYQDTPVNYGHENVRVSPEQPFYGGSNSHGTGLFRVHYPISIYQNPVEVQQCYDPVRLPANQSNQ